MATYKVTLKLGTGINSATIAYYNADNKRTPESGYNTQSASSKSYTVYQGKNFYIYGVSYASGYTGWNLTGSDTGSGSGSVVNENFYPTGTSTLTLTGTGYTPSTYTLEVICSGCSATVGGQYISDGRYHDFTGMSSGSYKTISSVSLSSGYTYPIWHYGLNGTTKYYLYDEYGNKNTDQDAWDLDISGKDRVVTIYATEQSTYTVTANPDGGTFGTLPSGWSTGQYGTVIKSVTSGSTIGNLPSVTRTNYKFDGWYNGSTKITTSTKPTSNMTITASWTYDPPTFSVTYSKGTGQGTPPTDSNEYENGEKVTVKDNMSSYADTEEVELRIIFNPNYSGSSTTTKYGYKTTSTPYDFDGYKHSTTGSVYKSGGYFYMGSSDVTLTAQWKKAGSSSTSYSDVTAPSPTRTGYNCTGWYDAASDGTKIVDAGGTWQPKASDTLYAYWSLKTATVGYNAGSGTWPGTPPTTNVTYDPNTNTYIGTCTNVVPTWDYHDFKGWDTNSSATSVKFKPGEQLQVDGNKTLYAVWAIQSHTVKAEISSDCIGMGSITSSGGTGEPGTYVTISCSANDGYKFVDWYYIGSAHEKVYTGWSSSHSVQIDYTDKVYFAEFKPLIDKFYWTNSSSIRPGNSTTFITTADWDRFIDAIKTLQSLSGITPSTLHKFNGRADKTIYAKDDGSGRPNFNEVRSAIIRLEGYGQICAAVNSGDKVMAKYFEEFDYEGSHYGSNSIKSAFNRAVDYYLSQ